MKERIEILEKKVQVIQEVLEETLKMLDSINFVRQPSTTKPTDNSIKSRVYRAIDKSIKNSDGFDGFVEIPLLEGEKHDEVAAQVQELNLSDYITSIYREIGKKREIFAVSTSIEDETHYGILYVHWF